MNKDKMILGKDVSFPLDSLETGLNNNVLVCGGSGSGKTMSLVEPRLLTTCNASLVVTLTKRKLVNRYRRVFESRGYRVEELNFAVPQESTVAYDPLAYINSYEDITFLARSIVMADPKKEKHNGDPYWDQSAISLLSAEIALVLMMEEDPNFGDVLALHDSIRQSAESDIEQSQVGQRFADLEKSHPGCFALTCWNTFRNNSPKTASCIFSVLNAALFQLSAPRLREMLAMENKLEFEDLADAKTVVFVVTSAVNPSLQYFVNLFYSQMFKSFFEYGESQPEGALPRPVHVLCDDFATGGRILNFPEYISIFREKGLAVTLLVQSHSQLESMYGRVDATTIINNCDTYVYMGGMDLVTAREISERANLPLEEILYMPLGREFIFRRGMKPIQTERYQIRTDPEYQKWMEDQER